MTIFPPKTPSFHLDTRGLRCPLPVIKAEAQLRRMTPGQTLRLITDDPIARLDIPHFCTQGGHMVTTLPVPDDGTLLFDITHHGAKKAPIS